MLIVRIEMWVSISSGQTVQVPALHTLFRRTRYKNPHKNGTGELNKEHKIEPIKKDDDKCANAFKMRLQESTVT